MKSILLAAALIFLGTHANAVTTGNYIKGSTGLTLGGETEVNGMSADLDDDFLTPLIFAYGFNLTDDFQGEFEFSYRSNDYEGAGNTDAEVLALAFNVVNSWVLQNNLFLTGGVGGTLGQYDLAPSIDGFALGLQVFIGMDYKIHERTTIGGEFRHFRTLTEADDADFDNTSLLFTAKYDL